MNPNDLCPCKSGSTYFDCCGLLIADGHIAATAEALMRSRYTAYVIQNPAYILSSWHSSKRPSTIDAESMAGWYDLQIIRTEQGGKDDTKGVVEYKAQARRQSETIVLHEISRFIKEEGRWYYVDGELQTSIIPPVSKVGRNVPCPCGSGRKFKKCCG